MEDILNLNCNTDHSELFIEWKHTSKFKNMGLGKCPSMQNICHSSSKHEKLSLISSSHIEAVTHIEDVSVGVFS